MEEKNSFVDITMFTELVYLGFCPVQVLLQVQFFFLEVIAQTGRNSKGSFRHLLLSESLTKFSLQLADCSLMKDYNTRMKKKART